MSFFTRTYGGSLPLLAPALFLCLAPLSASQTNSNDAGIPGPGQMSLDLTNPAPTALTPAPVAAPPPAPVQDEAPAPAPVAAVVPPSIVVEPASPDTLDVSILAAFLTLLSLVGFLLY